MDKDIWKYVRKKQITLQLKGEDLNKALWYREYIRGCLQQGKKIRPIVFENFLSFFMEIDSVEMRPTDHKIIKSVCDYFTTPNLNRHYWFSTSYQKKNPNYKKAVSKIKNKVPQEISDFDFDFNKEYFTVHYTLRHLIYDVFGTVNRITDIKKDQTDKFVKACYMAIEKHLENNLQTQEQHEFFGHYKRTVLATFICSQCGWKFKRESKSNNEPITPEDWFQLGRHKIEEMPIDKIRFHPKSKKKKS